MNEPEKTQALNAQALKCTVTADIAAKAVRKAKAVIAEHGADGVATLLQGKLGRGDLLLEAGLVAQVKVPKPAPAA